MYTEVNLKGPATINYNSRGIPIARLSPCPTYTRYRGWAYIRLNIRVYNL